MKMGTVAGASLMNGKSPPRQKTSATTRPLVNQAQVQTFIAHQRSQSPDNRSIQTLVGALMHGELVLISALQLKHSKQTSKGT